MQILTFANNKGGQGKTTSALGVAHRLAALGHSVLFIDADPQANATLTLGTDPARGHLGDALLDASDGRPSAHTLATLSQRPQPARSLAVVAANRLMGQQEKIFGTQADYIFFFKRQLAGLASQYDYVVLDTPPSLGPLTLSALAASHAVFVPMVPDLFGSAGMAALLEMVERIRQNFNERLRVGGIFFTKYAPTYRRALHRQYAGDLQEDQGLAGLVLTQTIRENIALAEAQSMQQPVYDYAPSSSGAADYAALTDEILRRLS